MYLTIEDLEKETGYSRNTIYNLSVGIGIKPKKGLIVGNAGKGAYSHEDLKALLLYKELVTQGIAKEEAYVRAAEILSHRS